MIHNAFRASIQPAPFLRRTTTFSALPSRPSLSRTSSSASAARKPEGEGIIDTTTRRPPMKRAQTDPASTKTSEQLSTFTSFSRASTSLSSISTPTIMSGLSKTPTASPKASKKSPGPFCPSCTSSPSPSSDETKTLASQNPQPRSDPASRMKNELLPATPTAETKIQPSSTRRPPLRPPADVLASRRPSPSLASYKPLNDVQQKTLERDQCSIERESEREEQEETPERKKQREELDTARGSLGEEQRDVLKRVISGESIFFTGSAGTGKTFLLRQIIAELSFRDTATALTASTGVAASNFSGRTLHSWAGVGLGHESERMLMEKIIGRAAQPGEKKGVKHANRRAIERWRKTDVLIIDEISMLDGRFFDKLEHLARKVREDERPFGGMQLVLCGDFLQLPPIPHKDTKTSRFCFEAKSWPDCVPNVVSLSKVYRQDSPVFINLLNKMRQGTTTPEVDELLMNSRSNSDKAVAYSHLYPVKGEVAYANQARLDELPGEIHRYTSQDKQGFDLSNKRAFKRDVFKLLNDGAMSDTLDLKIGAQVILVMNEAAQPRGDGLVNGSLGKVTGFMTQSEASRQQIPQLSIPGATNSDQAASDVLRPLSFAEYQVLATDNEGRPIEEGEDISKPEPIESRPNVKFPVVEFFPRPGETLAFGAKRRIVTPKQHLENVWLEEQGRTVTQAARTQLPLSLAWALSIHKSQGQTLSHVLVDFARIFEAGQAYVAVSRCQSLEGLKILNYHPSKVRASGKVLEWQKSHGIRDAPELPKPLAPSQMSTPTTEVAKDETELDKG